MDRELADKHEDLSSALITHIKPGCGSMYLYPRPGVMGERAEKP